MDVLSSPWNDARCNENLHRPNIAVYLQINMTLDFSIFRILFNPGKLAMTDHCKVQKNRVVLAPCVMFRFLLLHFIKSRQIPDGIQLSIIWFRLRVIPYREEISFSWISNTDTFAAILALSFHMWLQILHTFLSLPWYQTVIPKILYYYYYQCARHCSKYFKCVKLFYFHGNSMIIPILPIKKQIQRR